MDELQLRETVANNIATLRKGLNLTQLELAEKLNYSDKSISKWERAEAIPDAVVLMQLARLFHVRVDDLLSENASENRRFTFSIRKRILIPAMSAMLVFLLATVAFAVLVWVAPNLERSWLVFVLALPIAAIVLLIFSAISKHPPLITLFVSLIIWTLALSAFIFFENFNKSYLFFIIAVPLQILAILWYLMLKQSKKRVK